ncbi:unnamed protein product [Rotaria sordida]|uniref:Uncharacterized protein n=1 Tax=Rotaria sordida TaxID=392033 RepID=A0A815I0V3_9BILA|nr:unnamed protein product [Rotaria sordida]
MVPSSGVIYSINVSDPTILATITTSFLNESSSISTNIGNFSATPGSTSGNYTLEQVSPSKQYDSIYDDNTNTLDTDRGYSVWRPVKQNI